MREPIRDGAIAWSVDRFNDYIHYLNDCKEQAGAKSDYHGMVDGIVWSDEYPEHIPFDKSEFNKVFCVLVNLRTSVILGEEISAKASNLLHSVRSSCPIWAFCVGSRYSPDRQEEYEMAKGRFFENLDKECMTSKQHGF